VGRAERTAYVNDCVFKRFSHSRQPRPRLLAGRGQNSLKDWDPARSEALSTRDPENVKRILREKDEALALATELCEKARRIGAGLTKKAKKHLTGCMDAYLLYVRGFRTWPRL